MGAKMTELLARFRAGDDLRPMAQDLELQDGDWNPERVIRNLRQDEIRTFGVYAGAKLRSAYQPILSVTHRRVVGYEALLRPFEDDASRADPALFLARSVARGEQVIVGWPHPVIDAQSTSAAVAKLEEAWEGFGHYDKTLVNGKLSVRPYRDALRSTASAWTASTDPHAAADGFFSCPGTLHGQSHTQAQDQSEP